jgi:hypothetical protein
MSVRLPERVRSALTLTRFQALVGLVAGVLSIGATVWGIVFATRTPVTTGEVVAIVLDARTEKPVPNAIVELGTPQGALISTLLAKEGLVRQTVKEGLYRMRVIHPQFGAEVRPVYVLAGHSQEIRVRIAPHPPPPPPVAVEKDKAGKDKEKDKDKVGKEKGKDKAGKEKDKPGALDKAGQAIKKLFEGK